MKFNVEFWKPRLVVLIIVTSLLSVCATVSSTSVIGVCPPVVEYDAEFQARTAEEMQALPKDSEVVKVLSDYAIMREQARGCQPQPTF